MAEPTDVRPSDDGLVDREGEGFYSIIDYEVDASAQEELLDAFVGLQEHWVRSYPGYVSARLFASVDGSRVYNVVYWGTEQDFRDFEATSDTAGRIAAIDAAIAGLSGRAEPRMTGPPRFRLARVVRPAPPRPA